MGRNDKDAALAAGYSLSMTENTKQKVWRPHVRAEFQRLQKVFVLEVHKALLAKLEAEQGEKLGATTPTMEVGAPFMDFRRTRRTTRTGGP